MKEKLKSAVHDLRYLLNQEYPRDSAVEFVSDHYQLELDDRHLLARCVFSEEEVKDHKDRLINPLEIEGRRIGIDGYNALITVESILKNDRVVLCDDGVVRDLQAVFGKYKMSDSTEEAIIKILKLLKEFNPGRIDILYDKQVSKSGELAGFSRRQMTEIGVEGDARTTVGTDAKVWEYEISASSDRVIIERSEEILDIPAIFLERKEIDFLDMEEI